MNAHSMRLNACSLRLSNILVSALALAAISVILLVPAQTALALDGDEGFEMPVCYSSDDGDDSDFDDEAEDEDWDDYATDDDLDSDGFDDEADDPYGDDEGENGDDSDDDEEGDGWNYDEGEDEDGDSLLDESSDLDAEGEDEDAVEVEGEDEDGDEGEDEGSFDDELDDEFYDDDDDDDFRDDEDDSHDVDGDLCGDDEDYDVAFFDGDVMDGAIEPSMVICLFDDVSDRPAQEAALAFHRTSAVSHEAGASTVAALPQPADNASSDSVPASASGFDAVDSPVSDIAVNRNIVQVTSHDATATTATERDSQPEGESDSPVVPLAALGSSALALVGGRRLIA